MSFRVDLSDIARKFGQFSKDAGKPGPERNVIAALSASFLTIAGVWFFWSRFITPPGKEHAELFSVACSVVGVVLGGILIAFRKAGWVKSIYMLAAGAVLAILGLVALFVWYEPRKNDWVVDVSGGHGEPYWVIVSEYLKPNAFDGVVDGSRCTLDQIVDEGMRKVTPGCAKEIAKNRFDPLEPDELFNTDRRDANRDELVLWYRIASMAIMLGLFLIVHWAIANTPGGKKKRKEPVAA